MRWISSTVELPDTRSDDPRLGHLLSGGSVAPSNAKVVIAGFPSDEGVRRNNGRPGAASAPDTIRRSFYRLTPNPTRLDAWRELLTQTVDLGNLDINPVTLGKNQRRFGELMSPFIARKTFVIILGGGHETAYAHFRAYAEAKAPVSILNLDAHLDVRPLQKGKPHSGSPFRQAIEDSSSSCTSYSVIGACRHSVASAHAQYVHDHGGQLYWRDEVNTKWVEQHISNLTNDTMVTFDMDALDQSLAPGVSAPTTGGLNQETWLTAAYLCGRSDAIRSVDICELNPSVDEKGQTASVAALTLWNVFDGLTRR